MNDTRRIIYSTKIDNILSKGLPLFKRGIYNWAFSYERIFKIISELQKAEVIIIGGSLYENIGQEIQHTGLNWSCNKENNETKDDYKNRSYEYTINYLKNIKHPEKYLYSITPKYPIN